MVEIPFREIYEFRNLSEEYSSIAHLLVVIALSSCSTEVDRAFKLYVQQEEAKVMGGDSISYNRSRNRFKNSALLLNTDELGELDRRVKEYKGHQSYMQREMNTRRRMIDDILN